MPRWLINFWTFLRQSPASAVWERGIRLSLICLFLVVGQSVPAAMALAAQNSDTLAVICTGSGLQLVQINVPKDGSGQDNAPQNLQTVCKCTLTRDTHSCISPPLVTGFYTPEFAHYVTYENQKSIAPAQTKNRFVSCRGPPAVALGNDTFSDPPPTFLVAHFFSRRSETT